MTFILTLWLFPILVISILTWIIAYIECCYEKNDDEPIYIKDVYKTFIESNKTNDLIGILVFSCIPFIGLAIIIFGLCIIILKTEIFKYIKIGWKYCYKIISFPFKVLYKLMSLLINIIGNIRIR